MNVQSPADKLFHRQLEHYLIPYPYVPKPSLLGSIRAHSLPQSVNIALDTDEECSLSLNLNYLTKSSAHRTDIYTRALYLMDRHVFYILGQFPSYPIYLGRVDELRKKNIYRDNIDKDQISLR